MSVAMEVRSQGIADGSHLPGCHGGCSKVAGTGTGEKEPGMGVITAQVSLYPLRQKSIGPTVREAVRILREYGLETRIGEMSTLAWGEKQVLFAAL